MCNTEIQMYNIVAQYVINKVKTVPQKRDSPRDGFFVGFFCFTLIVTVLLHVFLHFVKAACGIFVCVLSVTC